MSPGAAEGGLVVDQAGPIDATVDLPGSKSITNRALVCAALAPGASRLRGALDADDTRAMVDALDALGVPVEWSDATTIAVGAGRPTATDITVDARQSGTSARFLLPLLALHRGTRSIDGDPQLRERPMGPSIGALRALGAGVVELSSPGHLPVRVNGPAEGGAIELAGDVSSQFLSGLLLSGPGFRAGLTIRLSTALVSSDYVTMTAAVMRAFGVTVHQPDATTWAVARQDYAGTDFTVEPDASTASYVMAAAVLTGGRATVTGLHRGSLQGDVAFADVLERMGARVVWHDDAVTVSAGERLVGIDVDMTEISDTVPTLCAVAALAEGPTRIRGVGFIRFKETDRIAAPVAELVRCGVDAVATDDGIEIRPAPGQTVGPATVETYRDHRMAMAFSLLGLVHPGIRIEDPTCVDKTFPGYWDLLDQLRTGTWPPARSV